MASTPRSRVPSLDTLRARLGVTDEGAPDDRAISELPSSEAVARFTVTCKEVIASRRKAYVKDKGGKRFMTIDHDHEHQLPTIDISAQFFRDNFARCSYLVRSGMVFRVALRGVRSPAYVRRHTKYSDPLDEVMGLWWQKVERQAWEEKRGDVLSAIAEMKRSNYNEHDRLLTTIQETNRGLTRMAQGLPPFNEGLPRLPGLSAPDRSDAG